jgi:hypothetical protein
MPRHVVVDGSNIATEGRSLPSLAQLDESVRAFLEENPDDVVTVVVDASFAHRIDPSELKLFEDAEAAGELVSPPAGAIGRGDAFLLRIAEKTGATVLSNDSFQEFHGEHGWLFTEGRLIGGKPVPGVGWIFTPRTPVRGPKSREAVKQAKRRGGDRASSVPLDSPKPGLDLAAERAKGKGRGKKKVEQAIAVATEEAVEPAATRPRRRRRSGSPPSDPVNEPLAFIQFVAAHPLGSEVVATVESFSSHGAFMTVDSARCYVPLGAMGDPPPRSAREVMTKGEPRTLMVQAFDPPRRGIELAVPGFGRIAGQPTAETVEAEIAGAGEGPAPAAAPVQKPARKAPRKAPAKRAPAMTAAPRKAAPAKAPAKKAPAKKAPAKKAPAKQVPAKPPAAKKARVLKAAQTEAPPREAPAKTARPKTARPKKAPPTEAPAKAVAHGAPVGQGLAMKAGAARASAKRTPAEKALAKQAPAQPAPGKPAQAGKAPGAKARGTARTAKRSGPTGPPPRAGG